MNSQVAIIMRVVAEPFAAAVAGVDAHRVRAEKVNVSHVPHQPLAREERTVADLTLEVARQHVRSFVLQQRGTVARAELAIAAVICTLPVGILGAVQADVLAQVPVENAAVWTDALKYERDICKTNTVLDTDNVRIFNICPTTDS